MIVRWEILSMSKLCRVHRRKGHAPTAKKGRLHRLEVVSALSQPGVDKLKEAWDRSHARGPVEEGVHAVFARPIPARATRS